MFQNLNKTWKFILIVIIYTIIALIEWSLHSLSLNCKTSIVFVLITLLECCLLMLSGFFYFQTFKYHRLWRSYYHKTHYESPHFYKYIGVPIFQFILINSFMRYVNPRVYLKGRNREYVKIFHEETKQSETAHILSLFVTFPVQLDYFVWGKMICFWSLTAFSIFFNIYPILLQRMNRFILEDRFKNLLGK